MNTQMIGFAFCAVIFWKAVASSCNIGCLICTPENKCSFCDTKLGYYLDKNLVCAKTTIPFCTRISQKNACLECNSGMYLDSIRGTCALVPATRLIGNCLTYDSSLNCAKCIPGFWIANGGCKLITNSIPNCRKYLSEGRCIKCLSGYIVDIFDTNCTPLPSQPNCLAFTRLSCPLCNLHFSNDSNFALNTSMSWQVASAIMLTAPSQASWLTLPTCAPFFDPNCLQIDAKGTCLTCVSGFYSSNSTCVPIPFPQIANCLTYLNRTSCLICTQGFFAVNNTCTAVVKISNCLTYFGGLSQSTNCTECNSRYYLQGNQCLIRVSSVSIPNCLATSISRDACQICQNGFNLTSNGLACFLSISNCQSYATNSSSGSCLACSDGFYLSSDGTLQMCTLGRVPNCRTYSQSDSNCSQCINGFFLTNNTCMAHIAIPNCALYDPTSRDTCLQCTSGFFNFFISQFCYPISTLAPNCAGYNSTDATCISCEVGFTLSGGICSSTTTLAPNCKNYTAGACTNCTDGFMLSPLISPPNCTAPIGYVTASCSQLTPNPSGAVLTWSASPPTIITCNACPDLAYPITPQVTEAVCVANSDLWLYSGFQAVPNCIRYGYNISNPTQLQCMQCSSGFFVSRYFNTFTNVATYCRASCPLSNGLFVLIPDDFFGFVNICTPIGTANGFVPATGCAVLGRFSTLNSNSVSHYSCVVPAAGYSVVFNAPATGVVFDGFTALPPGPVSSLIDFYHAYSSVSQYSSLPQTFNFRGPLLATIVTPTSAAMANTISVPFVASLVNCDIVWSQGNTTFIGSAFKPVTGALAGLYTRLNPSAYSCMRCQPGFQPVYDQLPRVSLPPFPSCTSMGSKCASSLPYGGLPSFLTTLISCFSCASVQGILYYPTLFVEYSAQLVAGITSDILQFALPTNSTGAFEFSSPFDCLPAIPSLVSPYLWHFASSVTSCSILGIFYPVLVSTNDPDRTLALSGCLACAAGFYPLFWSTPGVPFAHRGINQPPYVVINCVASANCDLSAPSTAYSFCPKCASSVQVGNSTFSTAYVDLMLYNCQPSYTPNCFILSSTLIPNTQAYSCSVCRAGFYLNPDALCEILIVPLAPLNATFVTSYFVRKYPNLPVDRSLGIELYHTYLHSLISASGFTYGVSACGSGFTLMPVHANYPSLCVTGSYLASIQPNLPLSTAFVPNCRNFFYQNPNGGSGFACWRCNTGWTSTTDGLQCLTAVAGCQFILSSLQPTTCATCLSGFLNVAGSCLRPNIGSCLVYNNNQTSHTLTGLTCLQCASGTFLTSNSLQCIPGNLTNCGRYSQGSSAACLSCSSGSALVQLSSTNQIYCYPIPSSLNCSVMSILNATSNGTASLSCTTCQPNSFLVSNVLRNLPGMARTLCLLFVQIPNCKRYDQGNTTLAFNTFSCLECQATHWLSSNPSACNARRNTDPNCLTPAPASDSCAQCSPGFFLSPNQTVCLSDPSGAAFCATYASDSSCSGCLSGFFLNNGVCQPASLVPNCLNYSGSGLCASCVSGYYLTASFTCNATSVTNCANFDSKGVCQNCTQGFGLASLGGILTCITANFTNCVVATSIWPFRCLTCLPGFFPSANGPCVRTNFIIASCKEYDSATTCSRCRSGFALSPTSDSCLSFELPDNLKDPNCNSTVVLPAFTCSLCQSGFYLSGQECVSCGDNFNRTFCQHCDPRNASVCLICRSGAFMSANGTCKANFEINTMAFAISDTTSLMGVVLAVVSLLLIQFLP